MARNKRRSKKRGKTFRPGRPQKFNEPGEIPKGKAGIIRWVNDNPGVGRRIKAKWNGKNANETYTGSATTDARKEAQVHVSRGVADPKKGDRIEFQEAHGPRDRKQVDDIRAKEKAKGAERNPVNNRRGCGGGRNPKHYYENHGGGSS